ncbi:cytochrome c [Paralcaligenes sp. KSB-10]|uniref:c-type cytochrome n=1 Tax=Paralcaligenes sp. KSB-10 TaxID=2901142 RepID=UPI001E348CB0|nr:cytochrome c [Paralcaligenes sp. KSB-10]UHL64127.1 cytochrome c [Paralcaligenes sp. KSB-10]
MAQDKISEAQKREMPEPSEGSRPIPWAVIVIVAAAFLSAVAYLWMTPQSNDPSLGDHRIAADFAVAKSSSTGAVDGAQIYAAQCVACHQANGAGLPGVFPPLAESEWVLGKPEVAARIVLHGVTGPLKVKGATYNGQMPTFKDKLSDKEIAAVLTHVRSSFGNKADKVDEALVKKERAATQSHDKPWNGDAELDSMR